MNSDIFHHDCHKYRGYRASDFGTYVTYFEFSRGDNISIKCYLKRHRNCRNFLPVIPHARIRLIARFKFYRHTPTYFHTKLRTQVIPAMGFSHSKSIFLRARNNNSIIYFLKGVFFFKHLVLFIKTLFAPLGTIRTYYIILAVRINWKCMLAKMYETINWLIKSFTSNNLRETYLYSRYISYLLNTAD